jgi:hypothetical protein
VIDLIGGGGVALFCTKKLIYGGLLCRLSESMILLEEMLNFFVGTTTLGERVQP